MWESDLHPKQKYTLQHLSRSSWFWQIHSCQQHGYFAWAAGTTARTIKPNSPCLRSPLCAMLNRRPWKGLSSFGDPASGHRCTAWWHTDALAWVAVEIHHFGEVTAGHKVFADTDWPCTHSSLAFVGLHRPTAHVCESHTTNFTDDTFKNAIPNLFSDASFGMWQIVLKYLNKEQDTFSEIISLPEREKGIQSKNQSSC